MLSSQCVVEFAVREQTGIGGDDRVAELHYDAAVEMESKNVVFRFTRRVRQSSLTSRTYLVNPGLCKFQVREARRHKYFDIKGPLESPIFLGRAFSVPPSSAAFTTAS